MIDTGDGLGEVRSARYTGYRIQSLNGIQGNEL